MQIGRDQRRGGKPNRQQLLEWGPGGAGNSESEPAVGRESSDQRGQTDEAPFLTDVAADEVVEWERQKSVLLSPLAEPHAQEPTGSHRDQRLPKLVAHLGRRAAGIEERDRPKQHVMEALRLVPH